MRGRTLFDLSFLNIEAGAQYTLGEAKFSKLLSPNIQLGLDMQKYPESKVVVTGYADAGTGNDKTNDGQTIHLYYDAMTGLFSRWKLPSEIPATTAGHISCACDIRKKTNFWGQDPLSLSAKVGYPFILQILQRYVVFVKMYKECLLAEKKFVYLRHSNSIN